MDPQVEAAFDAFLASIGASRNTQIPVGQEAYYASMWESFLLNYGKQQGRTILAAPQGSVGIGGVYQGPPGGSFQVPVMSGGGFAGPGFTRQPSNLPVARQVAAPNAWGGSQSQGPRYTPPPNQNQAPTFSVRPGGA